MVFRIFLNICFYKVGCRKFFFVEYVLEVYIFKREGRKWFYYVIKISVEIEEILINYIFQDIYYIFLVNIFLIVRYVEMQVWKVKMFYN